MRPARSGATGPGRPALLVHGGAWAIPDHETAAHRDGLRLAVGRGREMLEAGASALDVVEAVVAALEAHGAFDAGRGAVLDRSGRPQLDAGLMCGATHRWGAVAHVRQLADPVRAARLLLESDGQARLLVGADAETFAVERGLRLVPNASLITERERRRFEGLRADEQFHTSRAFSGEDAPRGTVGCVALDGGGRLATATSTGGAPYARPGRVGDSPLVGAGYYAGAEAAASATGWGEAIATVLLCGRAVDAVANGAQPVAAAEGGLTRMARTVQGPGGRGAASPAPGGLMLNDRSGRGGWAFTSPRMARAAW
ncbi:MAG: isoaspartyl peptidase/L-asparaginase, partial [Rhodothermales bacterium]|nr:isoaspartyl peptidase/L-asparaginase [Rhodothermales bacterium]